MAKVAINVICDTQEEADAVLAVAFGSTKPAAGKGKGKKKAPPADVEDDIEDDSDDEDDAPAKPAKKAKGKAKSKPAADVEDDDDSEDDSDDEEDDAESDDDSEDDSDDEDGPTLAQVVQEFQRYAKKNGRPAALDILRKKFKVKSVNELEESTYTKVIAALKAK